MFSISSSSLTLVRVQLNAIYLKKKKKKTDFVQGHTKSKFLIQKTTNDNIAQDGPVFNF